MAWFNVCDITPTCDGCNPTWGPDPTYAARVRPAVFLCSPDCMGFRLPDTEGSGACNRLSWAPRLCYVDSAFVLEYERRDGALSEHALQSIRIECVVLAARMLRLKCLMSDILQAPQYMLHGRQDLQLLLLLVPCETIGTTVFNSL